MGEKEGNTLKMVKTLEAANCVHCKTSCDGASIVAAVSRVIVCEI